RRCEERGRARVAVRRRYAIRYGTRWYDEAVRTVAGLLLLAGCDTLFGLQTVPRDGAAIDAPRDAPPPDAPPGMTCAGSLLRHCEPTATIAGVTLVIGS